MTDPTTDTLETILRQCAAAAPHPWYPRGFAESNGVPPGAVDAALDRLRLRGLVQLTEWEPGRGQGYALTPHGDHVLHNARLLAQLRSGNVPAASPKGDGPPAGRRGRATPYERGEAIREALLERSTPVVTRALIGINVLVFLVGLFLAVQRNVPLQNFLLAGDSNILELTGAVSFVDLLRGEWWRLLTSCFVHVGVLHLAVNMYALYNIGPPMEQFLGRWRYLAVYLVAGFGGSCIGVIGQLACAGASGAICGLLGALAAWTFLNRQYLPPPVLASLQRYLLTNSILIAAISLFGYQFISWSGHLGGAVFGLVAGGLFNVQRFGSRWQAGLALLGVLALPFVGLGTLAYMGKENPRWRGVRENLEIDQFNTQVLSRFNDLRKAAGRAYEEQVVPVINRHPSRRDPATVEKALTALSEGQSKLRDAEELLAKAGPYTSPRIIRVQEAGKQWIGEWLKLFQLSEDYLKKGEMRTEKDEQALRDQQQRVDEARDRWDESFKDK